MKLTAGKTNKLIKPIEIEVETKKTVKDVEVLNKTEAFATIETANQSKITLNYNEVIKVAYKRRQLPSNYSPGKYNVSPQEFTIRELIINGKSEGDISKHMKIAAKTVKFHKTKLYRKYKVKNALQLMARHIQELKQNVEQLNFELDLKNKTQLSSRKA